MFKLLQFHAILFDTHQAATGYKPCLDCLHQLSVRASLKCWQRIYESQLSNENIVILKTRWNRQKQQLIEASAHLSALLQNLILFLLAASTLLPSKSRCSTFTTESKLARQFQPLPRRKLSSNPLNTWCWGSTRVHCLWTPPPRTFAFHSRYFRREHGLGRVVGENGSWFQLAL